MSRRRDAIPSTPGKKTAVPSEAPEIGFSVKRTLDIPVTPFGDGGLFGDAGPLALASILQNPQPIIFRAPRKEKEGTEGGRGAGTFF
jgi:hypothetical protein